MSARLSLLEHRPNWLERAKAALAKHAHCPKCRILMEVEPLTDQLCCPKCGEPFQFKPLGNDYILDQKEGEQEDIRGDR